MSIVVRKLSSEELLLANIFFNRIYKSNRTFGDFEWEFVNGPSGPAVYIGAIDTSIKTETKIVGIQCAIPLSMIAPDGQEILTAKSEDTLVDPEYRGQEIFDKMYALLFEECKNLGVKYIWGFTPAYKPFVKLGFQLHFKTNQLLYVQKPIKAFQYLVQLNPKNRFIDKFKILGLCILSKALSYKSNFHHPNKSFTVNYNTHFELPVNLNTDKNLLKLNENGVFVQWRFTDNPHNNYRSIVFCNSDKETVADIIVSSREDVGYIERIIFDKSLSTSEKREIIVKCLNALEELNLPPIVRFLGSEGNSINKSEIRLLEDIGFFKVKRGAWFIWKSLDDNYKHQPEEVFLNRLFSQGVL